MDVPNKRDLFNIVAAATLRPCCLAWRLVYSLDLP
jgi:hypothetical protein